MRLLRDIALGIVAVVALFFATYRVGVWADNRGYAARVFDEVVQYNNVVASVRWSRKMYGSHCSYAVVEISPDAPVVPPSRLPIGREEIHSIGGPWAPTPAAGLDGWTGDGPWTICRLIMGDKLFERLDEAMRLPDGWWIERGSEVHFYSVAAGLAFRIRDLT